MRFKVTWWWKYCSIVEQLQTRQRCRVTLRLIQMQGAVLIKLFESEIDLDLRHCLSHSKSKAYKIWHMNGLKACSSSRQVRCWRCQNLTYLELEHELDLWLKMFYKHCPWCTWLSCSHFKVRQNSTTLGHKFVLVSSKSIIQTAISLTSVQLVSSSTKTFRSERNKNRIAFCLSRLL